MERFRYNHQWAVHCSRHIDRNPRSSVRSLVETGQYPSASAVLQRGLELLRQDHEMREGDLQALRSLIDRRSAGEFIGLEEGEAETLPMLDRRNSRAAP